MTATEIVIELIKIEELPTTAQNGIRKASLRNQLFLKLDASQAGRSWDVFTQAVR